MLKRHGYRFNELTSDNLTARSLETIKNNQKRLIYSNNSPSLFIISFVSRLHIYPTIEYLFFNVARFSTVRRSNVFRDRPSFKHRLVYGSKAPRKHLEIWLTIVCGFRWSVFGPPVALRSSTAPDDAQIVSYSLRLRFRWDRYRAVLLKFFCHRPPPPLNLT
jgi:hypothetical protein